LDAVNAMPGFKLDRAVGRRRIVTANGGAPRSITTNVRIEVAIGAIV